MRAPGARAYLGSVNRFTFTGRSLPLVRREGICTGCFFFQAAKVIGPSGVSIIRSSVESVICDGLPEGELRAGKAEKGDFLIHVVPDAERNSQFGANYA